MEKSFAELEYQVETLSRRVAELDSALKAEKKRADSEHAGKLVAIAAAQSGVRPNAITDVVYRATSAGEWRLDQKGKLVRYGADGLPEFNASGEDMTPQRAVSAVRESALHLWPEASEATQQPSQPATAAQQGKRPTVHVGDNPWMAATRNLTKQAEIAERDPALAERLAAAAGRPVISAGLPGSRNRG